MTYYDENWNIIKNPDLENGCVTEVKFKIGEHTELMAGTEGMGKDGHGLFRTVEDFEIHNVYYPNSETPETSSEPTLEERISALEETIDALLLDEMGV